MVGGTLLIVTGEGLGSSFGIRTIWVGLMILARIVSLMKTSPIALVAHDNKKLDMAEWALYNKEILKNYPLIGTEGTARVIQNLAGLKMETFGHGPDGGDVVIANAILEGKIGLLVFFIDVRTPHGHEHDIQTLIRISVLKNIPLALDRKTADFLISSALL